MKRTIFFDLGNVLIFFDHQKMCQQVATVSGLQVEEVQNFMNKYTDAYERGTITSAEIHKEICLLAGKSIPFQDLMEALSTIFEPNQPVIAIAEQLKEKGHPLFLLSNTCDAHFTFIKKEFPFLQLFDGCILSYELGVRKPETHIYERALNIAGCQRGQCFYTDDLLPFVESARSMHIDAELYTTAQSLIEHLHARGI